MPKSRRNRKKKIDRVEVVMGRQLFVYTGNTLVTIAIQPASFTRALAIADNFQFFRFRRLRCTIAPTTGGSSFATTFALGYAPGSGFDTPPSSNTDVMQLPKAVFAGAGKSVDTILDIGPSELVSDNPLRWFKTIVGTPDTHFEVQGILYGIASNGTTFPVNVIIEYELELQSWNLASNSPFAVPVPLKSSEQHTCSKEENGVVIKNSDTVVIGGVTYKKSTA